jgi:hypothetical protein
LYGYAHCQGQGPTPEGHRYPWPDSYQLYYLIQLPDDENTHSGQARDAEYAWGQSEKVYEHLQHRVYHPLLTTVIS